MLNASIYIIVQIANPTPLIWGEAYLYVYLYDYNQCIIIFCIASLILFFDIQAFLTWIRISNRYAILTMSRI